MNTQPYNNNSNNMIYFMCIYIWINSPPSMISSSGQSLSALALLRLIKTGITKRQTGQENGTEMDWLKTVIYHSK